MFARPLAVLAALLFIGCTIVAPKSRIEPHERVAVELRGEMKSDLGSLVGEREIETRFASVVSSRLSRRRSIAPTPERADAILVLRLDRIEIRGLGDGRAALRISAASRIESGGEDPGKPRAPWRAIETETPARPRSDWSESDGRALREDLEAGFARLADEIVLGASRAPESKQPRSGSGPEAPR